MSIRLYVGNLPKEPIERDDLQAVFADAGDDVTTKVIKDRKTGKCRGFAFVTVPSDEIANELIEKHNGESFMDATLKIEKALPRSKSKPNKSEGNPVKESSGNNANASGRRSGGKKRYNNSNSGSVQPDPRWADELAKLKDMLAAQTSNS